MICIGDRSGGAYASLMLGVSPATRVEPLERLVSAAGGVSTLFKMAARTLEAWRASCDLAPRSVQIAWARWRMRTRCWRS